MTKKECTDLFKSFYPNVYKSVKDDYCAVQLAWSLFIDGLCRDKLITEKQYASWSFPFKR